MKHTRKTSVLRRAAMTLLISTALCVLTLSILTFRYFFSDWLNRSRILTVPSLVGRHIDGFSLPFEERALYEIIRIERYDDAPKGIVLKQTPSAGCACKVTPGKRCLLLTLYVSKGTKTETVPLVKGRSVRDARLLLLRKGFGVHVTETYSTRPYGEVLSVFPASDVTLPYGENVTLTVSRGAHIPHTTVPSVVGETAVRAESLLQSRGLRVGKIRYEASDRSPGTVLLQQVPANESLPEGASVDLTVSVKRTEEPKAMPKKTPQTKKKQKNEDSESQNRQPPPSHGVKNPLDELLSRLFPNP